MTDELVGGSTARRVPRAVTVSLGVLVAGGLVALRLAQAPAPEVRPRPSGSPSPSVSAWPAGSVTPLAPLCGGTTAQPDCPAGTPSGVYESQLTGLNIEHPFTFRLPTGWSVTPVQYATGIDLHGPASGIGVSLLLSPRSTIETDTSQFFGARGLAEQVAQDPLVIASAPVPSVVDGSTAWQVDVRLRKVAAATFECRIDALCYPVAYQYLSLLGRAREVAAGAFADHAIRLVYLDLPTKQTALLWIWDLRRLADVAAVVDSLHFCTVDQGCPTVSNPLGLQPKVSATPQP